MLFSNYVSKIIIILPTLALTNPNLEIFLFSQHNSIGGGNLKLRQTILYETTFCGLHDLYFRYNLIATTLET
jgi:hypothetical protein